MNRRNWLQNVLGAIGGTIGGYLVGTKGCQSAPPKPSKIVSISYTFEKAVREARGGQVLHLGQGKIYLTPELLEDAMVGQETTRKYWEEMPKQAFTEFSHSNRLSMYVRESSNAPSAPNGSR